MPFPPGLFAVRVVALIAHFDGGLWPLRLGAIRLRLLRAAEPRVLRRH